MNRNIIIGVIVALVIIGGVAYVATKDTPKETTDATMDHSAMPSDIESNTGSTGTTSSSTTVDVGIGAEISTGAVKEFRVEGKNMSFTPSTMTVNKGDRVKITFVNTQGFHDFVLDEFNVKTKQVQAGVTETIEFVADKTGTFEYYCSVGNHRAMGMKGTLTVL